jgi:hypothetical protein
MLSHIEVVALSRCYAALADSSLATFRYTLSVPCKVFFLNFLTLEGGAHRLSKKYVHHYQLKLPNNAEGKRSRLQRGGSLKSPTP